MITAALMMLAASTAQPRPAPFGVPKGTPISKLRQVHKYGAKYFVIRPPVPNPAFEQYTVTATPRHGVCGIRAATEMVDLAVAAARLKEISKLLGVYGTPLLVGGLADLPIEAIRQISPSNVGDYSERYWHKGLPNNLRSISAKVQVEDTGYRVEVWYYYDNMPRCADWEPSQNRVGI